MPAFTLHSATTSLLITAFVWLTAAFPAFAEESDDRDLLVQYIEMQPSFVMNFGGVKSKLRYLKTDISLRVDTRTAADIVETHMPALRNEVILLLSRQTDEVMFDNLKREELRLKALEALNGYLQNETNNEAVKDLLFTNFVVQR